MYESTYSHIFGNHLYMPNTFQTLPNLSVFGAQDKKAKNYIRETDTHIGIIRQLVLAFIIIWQAGKLIFLPIPTFLGARSASQRILQNTRCADQLSKLLVNICKNAQECRRIFGIWPFSKNTRLCGAGLILIYRKIFMRARNYINNSRSNHNLLGNIFSLSTLVITKNLC